MGIMKIIYTRKDFNTGRMKQKGSKVSVVKLKGRTLQTAASSEPAGSSAFKETMSGVLYMCCIAMTNYTNTYACM